MATCNIGQLIDSACKNQFTCVSDEQRFRALVLQLLCDLKSAGGIGGGSTGQIKTYTNDPNVEGVVPDDQTKPAIAYSVSGGNPIYGWNVTTHLWV